MHFRYLHCHLTPLINFRDNVHIYSLAQPCGPTRSPSPNMYKVYYITAAYATMVMA